MSSVPITLASWRADLLVTLLLASQPSHAWAGGQDVNHVSFQRPRSPQHGEASVPRVPWVQGGVRYETGGVSGQPWCHSEKFHAVGLHVSEEVILSARNFHLGSLPLGSLRFLILTSGDVLPGEIPL